MVNDWVNDFVGNLLLVLHLAAKSIAFHVLSTVCWCVCACQVVRAMALLLKVLHLDFAGHFKVTCAWFIWAYSIARSSSIVNHNCYQNSQCFKNHLFQNGHPNQIVTNNGPQFTASEFKQFCKYNYINHTLTALYHTSSNGEAEQTFKQTMQKEKGDV